MCGNINQSNDSTRLTLALALAMGLAACGSDGGSDSDAPDSTTTACWSHPRTSHRFPPS